MNRFHTKERCQKHCPEVQGMLNDLYVLVESVTFIPTGLYLD